MSQGNEQHPQARPHPGIPGPAPVPPVPASNTPSDAAAYLAAFHISSFPLGISTLAEGRWVDMNQAMLDLFGYTREQVIGNTSADLGHWVELDVRDEVGEVLRRGEAMLNLIGKFRHASGRQIVLRGSFSPITVDGEPCVLSVCDDVTEAENAFQALSESERRSLEIIESISDGFYTLDKDWRFTYINAQAEQLWNRTRSQLLGRVLWEEFPPERAPIAFDRMNHAHQDREPVQFEQYSEWVRGWVEINVYPAADGGLTCYFRNVTDRKLREQALLEANTMKDEILGLVSHELRTPLTVIFGNSEILARRGETLDANTRKEIADEIERESSRLQQMIENLLILARPEPGLNIALEPVLLQHIVARVIQRHARRFPARGIESHLAPALPPIVGNPIQVEQVLENLLSNAEKYSPANKPIAVTLVRKGQSIHLTVIDQGPGFTPEEADHLFEPFFRTTTAMDRATGAGLGLAVCRRLVEHLGGTITVTSSPGAGTTATVILPIPDLEE
jgi:PAS domain S-box-containing protein